MTGEQERMREGGGGVGGGGEERQRETVLSLKISKLLY